MKITDDAAKAVLKVMMDNGLNPKSVFMEVGVYEGNLGMTFSREAFGRKLRFGPLTVVVTGNLDTSKIVVDVTEMNGRKGLIFKEDNA